MNKLKSGLFAICLSLYTLPAVSQEVLIDVLKAEIAQQQQELKKQSIPTYLISYRVDDVKNSFAVASFGSLLRSGSGYARSLTPTFRLGDYNFDNFREGNNTWIGQASLPIDGDDEIAIREAVWSTADNSFKNALNNYQNGKTKQGVSVASEDKSPSYSAAPAVQYYEKKLPADQTKMDLDKWKENVKKISAVFNDYPDLLDGAASVEYSVGRYYFINSEGTVVVQNRRYARLFVNVSAKAKDGMDLPLYLSYFAFTPDGLPPVENVIADAREMAKRVEALRDAPVVDPYTGPALLSGKSAGVFFHEIFGHRIEGQRMKGENDAQTFKKMVGQQLLPTDIQVFDDPTMVGFDRQDLNGYYLYDDEGVKSERVDVIRDGVLNDFLMTRVPIDGFAKSNGHARANPGMATVSRQGNLVIETKNAKTDAQLRQLLIDEAKAQGKEYGYLFEEVTGGLTFTGRASANSFNVFPTVVYKIYVDGRPDELVRGVDLLGTPLAMFSNIIYAGGKTDVFTGICGAESGQIPVTAISPVILVKKIETQRKNKNQDLPPVLPRPSLNNK